MFNCPCSASAAQRKYQQALEIADAHVMHIAEARKHFIEARAAEMIAGLREFSVLMEFVMDSSMADRAMVALRDAVSEAGHTWDGITAFHQILETIAKSQAAIEWDGIAPSADDHSDADDHAFESARQDDLDRMAA